MPDVFQDMVDALFSSDVAQDALYTPADTGIEPFNIRVVPSRDDGVSSFGATRIQSTRAVFEVRSSEVTRPENGDKITLESDNTNYTVKSARRVDDDRHIWFIDCTPVC